MTHQQLRLAGLILYFPIPASSHCLWLLAILPNRRSHRPRRWLWVVAVFCVDHWLPPCSLSSSCYSGGSWWWQMNEVLALCFFLGKLHLPSLRFHNIADTLKFLQILHFASLLHGLPSSDFKISTFNLIFCSAEWETTILEWNQKSKS